MGLRAACVVGAVLCGCGGAAPWDRAEALWRQQDPGAFRAWQALDAHSDAGARAHERLAAAERHFRDGIARLRDGRPGAREALLAGAALGPMDPQLYLELARACRERGLEQRAAGFYGKALAAGLPAPKQAEARAELAALDVSLDGIFDPPPPAPAPSLPAGARGLLLGLAAIVLGLAALAVRARRPRRRTLAELAREHPELQPAIAFLVGCLRHELLKHRLLAVADVVRALASGAPEPGQRELLVQRLYRGEPLPIAWAGHLGAFMRALGPRFDLERHDPSFRDAGRAIAEIASLGSAFAFGRPDAARRLERAFAGVVALDRALGALLAGLTHTAVDAALLERVVAEVRLERASTPGRAADAVEVSVGAVPPELAVEVYRLDLELILRNLVRNAWAAAARGPAPRRVALAVRVDLEPTGEEIVRIEVRDTNPELLPQARAGRGLDLVNTALERYGGCLESSPAGGGFAKIVTMRLFRALDDAPPAEAVA